MKWTVLHKTLVIMDGFQHPPNNKVTSHCEWQEFK